MMMPEHDDAALGTALAELADVVPDDGGRLDAVHAKIRRRHTRRRASRAVAGVAAAVAAIAGLVALEQRPTTFTVIPATTPAPAPADQACAKPPPSATKTSSPDAAAEAAAADAMKAAAAAKEAGARASRSETTAASGTSGEQRGVKGYGTVAALAGDSVTIHLDDPASEQPEEVVATITPDTTFLDHGTAASRPTLTVGEHVVFGALAVDAGYNLLLLETNPDPAPPPPAKQNNAAIAGAKASAADAGGQAGGCLPPTSNP
jgi:hypothetical protein